VNKVEVLKCILAVLLVLGLLSAPPAAVGQEPEESQVTLEELKLLIIRAIENEVSTMQRLPSVLFPDTRDPELIHLKTGFEKNFFLRPRIKTVVLVVDDPVTKTVSPDKNEDRTTADNRADTSSIDGNICCFKRIDVYLDGRSLVKKLHFIRSTLSFNRPVLNLSTLRQGKFKTENDTEVRLQLELPFEDMASFISRECGRSGAVIPDLSLDGEYVRARGRLRVMWFNLDLSAKGAIYLRPEDRTIRYRASRVAVGSLSIPRFLYKGLVNEFNPVFRFQPIVFNLVPHKLHMADSVVELSMQGVRRSSE